MSSTPPLRTSSPPPTKAIKSPTKSHSHPKPSPSARSKPSTSKSHHHHHHHHIPHRHSHSHEAPKTVQSALQPSTVFGELLSPVKSVAGGFPVGKRSSGEEERGEQGKVGEGENVARKVTWRDVERVRERRREVEAQNLAQLTHLQTLATDTTRRLDDTYYSLLSTLPALQDTLTQLRDLAHQSRSLLSTFTTASIPALTDDVSAQIAALHGGFDRIERERIAGLEARMKVARERVRGLGDRVEGVRGRVEAWEMREEEGRRRGRRNVGILWGVLGTMVGFFVLVVLYRGWNAGIDGLDEATGKEASWRVETMLGNGGMFIESEIGTEIEPERERTSDRLPQPTSANDELDRILHILDEL